MVAGAGTGNRISLNRFKDNGGLAIDLAPDGVMPNDPFDADVGANQLQNYPMLSYASYAVNSVTVVGTLDSAPSQAYELLLFSSDACDSSGYGEGGDPVTFGSVVYETGVVVVTDENGHASFTKRIEDYQSGSVFTVLAIDDQDNTSEMSPCLNGIYCGQDMDCDGFFDEQQLNHTVDNQFYPSHDNCPAVANEDQFNSDANFFNNIPPYPPYDYSTQDLTWPDSDAAGDACDDDDDNDGISDANEASGASCGSVVTDPVLRDTDGDRFLDAAECVLGTDPTSAASKPLVSQCGPAGDADGDKISDRLEFCYYGTDSNDTDTDGDKALDGGTDGCEVASINADRIVSSGDQGMLAAGISLSVPYHPNVDLNKDGVLSSGDQGLMASFITPSGQCPG
jgi:hypothetical protein